MRIIKFFPHAVMVSVFIYMSGEAFAHADHTAFSEHDMTRPDRGQSVPINLHDQHSDDHRKEHGTQLYTVTTVDQKWRVNEAGNGVILSEIESRIGTDENKIFIQAHVKKPESHDADYDLKLLYSRMHSDFWDAQIGLRYRLERFQSAQETVLSEDKLDAVLGLHGLAPYFFETDAYVFIGADHYAALSVKTERDVLLSQKLILKPYLDVDVVFRDEARYAKRTGLSTLAAGLETRYEISKRVMPYMDIAYAYTQGNAHTALQASTGAERNWLYGAGIRFKF